MCKFPYFLLLSALFFLEVSCYGGLGHALTGSIAYQLLSPPEQQFFQRFLDIMSQNYSYIEVFSEATRWADDLRSTTRLYDSWHYIQLCHALDNTTRCKSTRTPNSLTIFAQSLRVLLNKTSEFQEKGFYLLFLMHLLGDMHQPLHNINAFAAKFPRGDAGGNAVNVTFAGLQGNLHEFWDNLCSLQTNNPSRSKALKEKARKSVDERAAEMLKAQENLQENTEFHGNVEEAEKWVREGFEIAVNFAYAKEILEEGAISEDYAGKCREIVEKSLVLSGKRLASVLKYLYQAMQEQN